MLPKIDEIVSNFDLLDEWEERYRYLIELGRLWSRCRTRPITTSTRSRAAPARSGSRPASIPRTASPFCIRGDSDAHIVRGLVALLISLYSGKTAAEALSTDALGLFKELGLSEHLTPQRSNGVRSMVERIRRDAQIALASS